MKILSLLHGLDFSAMFVQPAQVTVAARTTALVELVKIAVEAEQRSERAWFQEIH